MAKTTHKHLWHAVKEIRPDLYGRQMDAFYIELQKNGKIIITDSHQVATIIKTDNGYNLDIDLKE